MQYVIVSVDREKKFEKSAANSSCGDAKWIFSDGFYTYHIIKI